MDVQMAVAVYVGKRQAGGGEALELGGQLPTEFLPPTAAEQCIAKAGADGVAGKLAFGIDQMRDIGRRQRRPAVGQDDVEADGQAGQAVGQGDRLREGVAGDHEADAGEQAAAVGPLDGAIDLGGSAEVVGPEYELQRSAGGRRETIKHIGCPR